jgi:YfiR/HmsC-like
MGALKARALRLIAFALALGAGQALAQTQQASEPTIKAAFLYKFAGYVEWPAPALPAPDTPVVIAITGNDDVATELEKLVPGRSVNGHPVLVRRLREGDSPRGAHVVFVGRGEGNARAAIRAAQQAGALVVAEAERGLEMGAAINFVPVDERIGFEVSLEAAEKSGVRISSRMLTVARRVVPRS